MRGWILSKESNPSKPNYDQLSWFLFLIFLQSLFLSLLEFWRMIGYYFEYNLINYHLSYYFISPLVVGIILIFSFVFASKYFNLSINTKTKLFFTIMIILQSIISLILVQISYIEKSIIASVWYVIHGFVYALIFYFEKGIKIRDQMNQLLNSSQNTNDRLVIIEKVKFYLDKAIVFLLTLGTIIGVMMTILWGNSVTDFQVGVISKFTEAVYMVLFFGEIIFILGIFYVRPLHEMFIEI